MLDAFIHRGMRVSSQVEHASALQFFPLSPGGPEHPGMEALSGLHPVFTRQDSLSKPDRFLYCFDAPCAAACPRPSIFRKFIRKYRRHLRGSALAILDATFSCQLLARGPVDVAVLSVLLDASLHPRAVENRSAAAIRSGLNFMRAGRNCRGQRFAYSVNVLA